MQIDIHIFPERLDEDAFELAFFDIQNRIVDFLNRAVISPTASIIGDQSFLNPETMEVIAVVQIRKNG